MISHKLTGHTIDEEMNARFLSPNNASHLNLKILIVEALKKWAGFRNMILKSRWIKEDMMGQEKIRGIEYSAVTSEYSTPLFY